MESPFLVEAARVYSLQASSVYLKQSKTNILKKDSTMYVINEKNAITEWASNTEFNFWNSP